MRSKITAISTWLRSPTGIAVNVLGITQIISWGTTLYSLAVLAAPISDDTNWSPTMIFGGLSIGLLISAEISTWAGYILDTQGARSIMSIGSILNAIGLSVLAYAQNIYCYLSSWILLGISMRLTLYDAAFAALVQVAPQNGKQAISLLTLWGGFASTEFWPIGRALNDAFGWRETFLIFAALNFLICTPLHWFGLAHREEPEISNETDHAEQTGYLKDSERTLAIVLFSFTISSYAFIFGASSAHLVALIEASDVSGSAAVAIASMKGIAQVGGRLWEIIFAKNMSPINLTRVPVWLMPIAFSVLLAVAGGVGPALVFTICFGVSNGLISIVRGALPLALFGTEGYGRVLGILATPYLLINAVAPLAFALIVENGSYLLGQWTLFGFALMSVISMEVLAIWYTRCRAI